MQYKKLQKTYFIKDVDDSYPIYEVYQVVSINNVKCHCWNCDTVRNVLKPVIDTPSMEMLPEGICLECTLKDKSCLVLEVLDE